MPGTLRVLILEDRMTDVELIVYELKHAGFNFEWQHAQTEHDYLTRLNDMPDIILADYTLPQFDALRALHLLQQRHQDIPFIVVTGSISEEVAVECMKQGASDYLLKDRLARLGQAVTRALEDKHLRDAKAAAEQALRQSEARYRQMFEKNNAIKLVIDPASSAIVDANGAACQFYGYTHEELTSKSILDLDVPDDDGMEWQHYDDREKTTYYVTQQRLASGEVRTMEAYSGPIDGSDGDDHKLLFSIIHDITERQRAEEALKRSEEHFRALIENSTELIALSDAQGIMTYASPSFERIMGYQPHELVGNPCTDYVHPDDLNYFQRVATRVIQNPGMAIPVEYRVHHRNGSWRILEAVRKNLLDNPAVQGVVTIARDVSERRQLEKDKFETEMLRIELDKDRELVTLRQRLISTIAHDFRTPLTLILTSSSSLERYYDKLSEEKRRHNFDIIAKAVGTMNALVNDVLTFSKARDGKMECNPQPLELDQFCLGLIGQFEMIDDKEHRFVYHNATGINRVVVDQKLLQHTMTNLLSNAVKYSPVNSEIRIDVNCDPDHMILRVRDQGIGIPEEDQKYLFEPFHRGANTKGIEGTGLGLSVVKSSLDACGGTIECFSAEGKGTTFTVRLPGL